MQTNSRHVLLPRINTSLHRLCWKHVVIPLYMWNVLLVFQTFLYKFQYLGYNHLLFDCLVTTRNFSHRFHHVHCDMLNQIHISVLAYLSNFNPLIPRNCSIVTSTWQKVLKIFINLSYKTTCLNILSLYCV